MRVCLDTNVLVSALATRGICADILQVVLAEHQLVLGETVLAEFRRVLREKMHVPEAAISEAEALLRREAVVITQAAEIAVELRDPDDVLVLAEAVASLAEVLVTGDRDFLDVADRLPVEALSPRQFWERLQGGGEQGLPDFGRAWHHRFRRHTGKARPQAVARESNPPVPRYGRRGRSANERSPLGKPKKDQLAHAAPTGPLQHPNPVGAIDPTRRETGTRRGGGSDT